MDAESLYEVAAAVPWARFMSAEQTVSVDAILGVVPDGLTHSHFTALTVKVRKQRRYLLTYLSQPVLQLMKRACRVRSVCIYLTYIS